MKNEIKTLVTHNGIFHADETMAIAVMKMTGVKFIITRTRDEKIINDANYVFDVGGIYDFKTNRFDHHMKETPTRSDGITPYSSAGLAWSKYGVAAIANIIETYKYNSIDICNITKFIDNKIFTPIDLVDNGQVNFSDSHILSWSHVISAMNPSWNSDDDPEEKFNEAVEMSYKILKTAILNEVSRVDAKSNVENANKIFNNKVLVLDNPCPWKKYVFDLKYDNLLYCIFPTNENTWMIQCVPDKEDSLGTRKPLPKKWAGLRNKELQELTGIENVIFCHPGRFIAGAETKEGVIKLAEIALK